ncbi:MAG: hypothetical protein P8J33_12335 [Pirellulaceae bacterium]|nr:hypothetical protein [Pirellulaceae bacterium]
MTAVNLRTLSIRWMVAGIGLMALPAISLNAQMINVQTPFQSNQDSFYERQGIGFGFSVPGGNRIRGLSPAGQVLPNVQLTQGSFGSTIPGFGGYQPNSSLRTGFVTGNGLSFGLEMGKGFRRSSVSQTPSVTMMNGGSASIFSGSQVPFITSINPVVGAGFSSSRLYRKPSTDQAIDSSSVPPSSYYEQSTASQGDLSVADIRKQRQASMQLEKQALRAELESLIATAESLEAQGKYGSARAKYGRALRKTQQHESLSDLRYSLEETLRGLRNKR